MLSYFLRQKYLKKVLDPLELDSPISAAPTASHFSRNRHTQCFNKNPTVPINLWTCDPLPKLLLRMNCMNKGSTKRREHGLTGFSAERPSHKGVSFLAKQKKAQPCYALALLHSTSCCACRVQGDASCTTHPVRCTSLTISRPRGFMRVGRNKIDSVTPFLSCLKPIIIYKTLPPNHGC